MGWRERLLTRWQRDTTERLQRIEAALTENAELKEAVRKLREDTAKLRAAVEQADK